jgi:hypothetical protein
VHSELNCAIPRLARQARGDLTPEEKHRLRIQWYTKLAKGTEKNREEYARYINHPPPPLDDLRDPTKRPGGNKGIMKSRKRINQRERASAAASAAAADNPDDAPSRTAATLTPPTVQHQ